MEVAIVSYNGSGLFQINTSGQPVVAGTVITASAFNALTADLATGLTTAITKDGQTATTAQIPFAQGLRSTLVTDSTNSTSGSIITDGGLGVAKAVNIGTTLGVTGAVTGSSTITGTKLIPTGTSVTGNGMYLPAANTLGFSTNGTNAVNIDASQNVGVGVTPSAWSVSGILQTGRTALSGGANAVGSSLSWNAYYNAGWKYYDSLQASQYTQSNGVHTWSTAASGTAGNAISFTQAMTLDASGNLGIGATSPAGKLDIRSSGLSGTDKVILQITDNVNTTFQINQTTSYSQIVANNVLTFSNGTTERARIDSSGNFSTSTGFIKASSYLWAAGTSAGTNGIYLAAGSANGCISQTSQGTGTVTTYIGNAAITAVSDVRLKENIVDTQRNATEILSQLRVVDHTWNDPSDQCENNRNSRGTWMGLIAQEAQPVIPWLVNKPTADVDENGDPQYWHMDYGYAVPLLIKALQEQQALITQLQADVAALKG